jgi:hypothetical protein
MGVNLLLTLILNICKQWQSDKFLSFWSLTFTDFTNCGKNDNVFG